MADTQALMPGLVADLEYYFNYLEHRFAELEETDQSWDELSAEDKNEFEFGWPVVEDKLIHFQHVLEREALPPAYAERYSRLQERIARDRPILEILWERP